MILGRNARRADKYREELINELLRENQRLREENQDLKDNLTYYFMKTNTRKETKNGKRSCRKTTN